ncbi:hypothetical protein Aab01nite_44540 [Paractinoplanes abujensis]|uniref:Uncharacterized protein n=1 Tax=Paractinoplanes abujensis TaxID=882441 RepID=A0A7W7CKD9_9ACTN|nr:hypothetical protein [Actinoplanes abujensis]MBB4690092.1 hypothetical protein [Actinoplanes abujensis]GID20864.1 hypothetical protein Aab01nite_44540 [Actinoplanes abujensis]
MSDTALTRGSLIAAEGETKSYEGAGLFESAGGIVDGIKDGDWMTVGGNAVAGALGLLGAVMDPLQAVFAAGVGWLMEHVSCLREPLDKLCGDPKAIEAHAQTWRNIEQRIYEATDFFVAEVKNSTAAWAAKSAEAYRAMARTHAESIQAMGQVADFMGRTSTIVGAMVGVVRNTIRDIVSEVIGACISKAIQALTVVLIPKVAAEVAILVAECSTKVLNLLKQLFAAIKKLGVFTKQMDGILQQIGQSSRNVLRLEAFRIEAIGTAGGTGRSGFKTAYDLISEGHKNVYGTVDKVIQETAKAAPKTNGAQNSGSTGDTLNGDNPTPTPIDLPL